MECILLMFTLWLINLQVIYYLSRKEREVKKMADTMVAEVRNAPAGFRFHPTEEELLDRYLLRKNCGEEDPVCLIPEVDLYRWEPEELVRKFRELSIIQSKDPQCWFFSEQRLDREQRRPANGGFWKETGSTRDVRSQEGTKQVIGSKKILTFFQGNSSSSTETHWIMHEYDLKGNALNSFPLRKNYVLCMIKCNSEEMADDGSIPESLDTLHWVPGEGYRSTPPRLPETSTSSADSFHRPRRPVTDAEETNTMAALGDQEKPATEPVSCSCSQSIKHCSSSIQSMVCALNLLMGVVLCIAIFRETFSL